MTDCRLYYTTILDENRAAISSPGKGAVKYAALLLSRHYTMYCFNGGKRRIAVEKENTGFGVNTFLLRAGEREARGMLFCRKPAGT